MALPPPTGAGRRGWRISDFGIPVRCVVIRVRGGFLEVAPSLVSNVRVSLAPGDLFSDLASCEAEIRRRRDAQPKERQS